MGPKARTEFVDTECSWCLDVSFSSGESNDFTLYRYSGLPGSGKENTYMSLMLCSIERHSHASLD